MLNCYHFRYKPFSTSVKEAIVYIIFEHYGRFIEIIIIIHNYILKVLQKDIFWEEHFR